MESEEINADVEKEAMITQDSSESSSSDSADKVRLCLCVSSIESFLHLLGNSG